MLSKLEAWCTSKIGHAIIAVVFALFAALGWYFLGFNFLTQWVGSVAAAISIFMLIWKSQGYWTWSIVNAVLWFILYFYSYHLPMLGGLQISYIIFSLYGLFQWWNIQHRIGYDHRVWTDNLGTVVSLGIFVYTVTAYAMMPGYAFTSWWWVEFFGVFISIVANWMDAFKYKGNWIGWTATNFLFGPLFWHEHLLGPFVLTFLYQAMCIVGYYRWYKEEKRLVAEKKVEVTGGVRVHDETKGVVTHAV